MISFSRFFPSLLPLVSAGFALLPIALPLHASSKVEIAKNGDQFQLMVNGQPFFINGVGGTHNLALLKQLGGNSLRTWGIESLAEVVEGKPLIDRAQDVGLMVTAGIWVQHQGPNFNYDDQAAVDKQRETVRKAVQTYKDSPALLIWGLGNETEGPASDGSDLRIWKELNVLAGIVKEEDPNHPVMTVIASATFSFTGPFWSMPTTLLSGSAAAGGLGAITSVLGLGSFISPVLIGWLVDRTHTLAAGEIYLAMVLLLGSLALLLGIRRAT